MLTRSDKQSIINEVKADIDKSTAVFVTNLVGLTANDSASVRKTLRTNKAKVVVARNTFFAKASKGTPCEALFANLKGPHAAVFAYADPAAVAKALKEIGAGLELVQVSGAVLDGKQLSVAEVQTLASLPSRDQMLGTLLATFIAPVSALARVLYAIKEKKEGVVAA